MKKNIITLVAIVIALATQAQTEQETVNQEKEELQTIFKSTEPLGWWIAPEFGWSQIKPGDENAFTGGFSGGIIIDHKFSIGLGGSWLIPSNELKYSGINDTSSVYLNGGYGGLKLEYRLKPNNKIHVAFPLLIGGGGLGYSVYGPGNWPEDDYDYDNTEWDGDAFFVIEPGVTVGLNLLKFMRLDAGLSYRYAPGVELPNTSSNLFNNLNAIISLKFGKF